MTLLFALIGTTLAANTPAQPTSEPLDAEMRVEPAATPAAPVAPASTTTAPASPARPGAASSEAFARCYRARLAAVPGLSGSVTVRAEIAADGSVPSAAATSEQITDQPFLDCLAGVARQLRYPAGAAGRVASWPLAFATE